MRAEEVAALEELSEEELRARLNKVAHETAKLSQELTGALGRPVSIRLINNGLGFTNPTDIGENGAVINVNPLPILANHPAGCDIFRGIGWHEQGHCRFHPDIGPKAKAFKEGGQALKYLLNLLEDEQLERAIRSERVDIGKLFDRMLKWMRERDIKAIDDARQDILSELFNEFRECVRMHQQPRTTAIAQAVALIPKKLGTLTEWELLDLARQIWSLLKKEAKRQEKEREQEQQEGDSPNQGGDSKPGQDQKDAKAKAGEEPSGSDESAHSQPDHECGQVLDFSELPEDLQRRIIEILKQALAASEEQLRKELDEARKRQEREQGTPGGQEFNPGSELGFNTIDNIVRVEKNQAEHARLLVAVRSEMRALRHFMENLGMRSVDIQDQTDGYDLVTDIERLPLFKDSDVFVDEEMVQEASFDLQIIVDCSGSMANSDKMERAKAFGALAAEALKGIRGISGHCWGFEDRVLYDCGDFRRSGTSSLKAGGGNNDAAALWHAAQVSALSGKDTKILLMISDGAPTQCTWESLRNLVTKLTREGFICVQVAIDRIHKPAFDHFVDLSKHDFQTSVRQFGKLLARLVRQHNGAGVGV